MVKSVETQVYFDVARRKMKKKCFGVFGANEKKITLSEKTSVVGPGHVRPHGPRGGVRPDPQGRSGIPPYYPTIPGPSHRGLL